MNHDLQNEGRAAFSRLGAAIMVWTARAIVEVVHHAPPGFGVIALDVALVAVQAWANRPLQRALGRRFGLAHGRGWSWTAILLWAWGLAWLALMRDLWFGYHGIPM